MSLEQKLEWCERACQGRKIDVVLGHHPHPELEQRWNLLPEIWLPPTATGVMIGRS